MLVLFGHQSVGQNILDGIEELARAGMATPHVTGLNDPPAEDSGTTLRHFRVGSNGQPLTKIQHFERTVSGDIGRRAQAAMFKFCYVDLREQYLAAPLFDAYAQMIDRLQRRRQNLLIAHVTMPLRAVPGGVISTARRLLGQRHPQLAANAARDAFNARLRARYGPTSPVFDLAAIQSGGPDAAPALLPRYTEDGGHLNEAGRRVVAREFLDFLERLAADCGAKTN